MKHRIEFLRRMFRFFYEAFFCVLLMLFAEIILCKETPYVPAVLMIFPLFLFSYLIREKVPNYLLLVLFHLLMGGMLFLLPFRTGTKVILLVFLIYCLDTSYLYLLRNSVLRPMDDIPWPSLLMCFFIYLYGSYVKSGLLIQASYFIPVILLILYLITVYLEGLAGYLDSTRDVRGLPLADIVYTNTMIVAAILVFLLVCLFLGKTLGLEKLLLKMGRALISFFRMIAGIVSLIAALISGLISEEKGGGGTPGVVKEEIYAHYSSAAGEILEVVLKLGFAFLILFLLYKLAVRLIRRLMMKRNYADDVIEAAEKKNDRREDKKPAGRLKLLLSREERFRRYYREKIQRYRYDIKLDRCKTCREIESELREKVTEDVSEITGLYSSVRYGGREVDRPLLKKMNELTKK